MTITEFIQTHMAECTEDTPLENVYNILKVTGQGFVVVIESKAHRIPLGIINEHTICEQLIGRRRDPRGLLAANIMESRIATVADQTSPEDCMALPDIHSSSPIFVVDRNRRLLGVLDKWRILRHMSSERDQPSSNPLPPRREKEHIRFVHQ